MRHYYLIDISIVQSSELYKVQLIKKITECTIWYIAGSKFGKFINFDSVILKQEVKTTKARNDVLIET